MVALRSPRLALAWLLTGLIIVPFGFVPTTTGDFVVRIPATLLVMFDAGVTLQFAIIYHREVWPKLQRVLAPRFRLVPPRPATAWCAAFGYYLLALFTVVSVVRSAAYPTEVFTSVTFVGALLLIAFWKTNLLRFMQRLARVA